MTDYPSMPEPAAISIVIRSHNEAPRLRLTLASLAVQTEQCEVVVVDDGSDDDTASVIAQAAAMPGPGGFVFHRNSAPQGRSAASNIGARLARGEFVLFLDGDTLADPALASMHLAVQRANGGCIARGETWHLRQTRPFHDPESGIPFADQAEKVARMPPRDRDRAMITRAMLRENFEGVAARAQPGVYPGTGPRRLLELEMALLDRAPASSLAWAAASGSNQSVPRAAFVDAGGFDPVLTTNEHRELALRLTKSGLSMAPVRGARTYHMIHRSGWRDPLVMTDWEDRFFARHRCHEVPLLSLLWAGLSDHPQPGAATIPDFEALEQAVAQCRRAAPDIPPSPDGVRALYQAVEAGQRGRAASS